MDEEAIGISIRNMKEERDRRGHIRNYSISSRQNEDVGGKINTTKATGCYEMAKEGSKSTAGVTPSGKRERRTGGLKKAAALMTLFAAAPAAMAESCISLSGSTTCPAFSSASISTDSTMIGLLYVLRRYAILASTDLILFAVHSCHLFRAPRPLINNCRPMWPQTT